MIKDLTIQWLIDEIAERMGPVVRVVDHWDADLFAIGFESSAAPNRTVYVSSWERRLGTYHFECQTDGSTTSSGEGDTRELLDALRTHLLVSP